MSLCTPLHSTLGLSLAPFVGVQSVNVKSFKEVILFFRMLSGLHPYTQKDQYM